jgi:hypothetical protein
LKSGKKRQRSGTFPARTSHWVPDRSPYHEGPRREAKRLRKRTSIDGRPVPGPRVMVARGRRSKSAETGNDTMFTFPISRRQADRLAARRPLVEDLEGRRLLSGIQGRHIGASFVPAIVGAHIGTSAALAIPKAGGLSDGLVGNHIGTNVA